MAQKEKEKKGNRLFIIVTGASLFGVLLALFYGAFTPGTFLFGHDTVNIYMPFKIFAQQAAAKFHDIPLWMPGLFLGIPLIASSSLLYYYPTDIFSILLNLNAPSFYTADMIIHLLIGFFGMYLFLRQLKIRRESAFFGGLAFMLSGFIVTYVNAGHWNNIKAGALIPFIFYFTEKAMAEKKLLHLLNASIFLALQILSTGMQIMAYTYMALLIYAGFRAFTGEYTAKEKVRMLVWIGIGAVFIALFSALQLLPSMGYTKYSWRGDFTYKNFISWSLPPAETITLLLPQFFGIKENYCGFMLFNLTSYYAGVMPYLLLPFAFMDAKKRKMAAFFSMGAVLMLLLSYGGNTPLYPLFYYVPVFNQFRNPARFMYIFTFFILVLAGMGLNNIFNMSENEEKTQLPRKFLKYTALAAAITAAGLFIMALDSNLYGMIGAFYKQAKSTTIDANMAGKIGEGIRQDVLAFACVSAMFLAMAWLVINKKMKNTLLAAVILAAVHSADVLRIDSKFISYQQFGSYVPVSDAFSKVLKEDDSIFRVYDFGYFWREIRMPNIHLYYGVEGVNGMHGLMPSKFIKMYDSGIFGMPAVSAYMNIKYLILESDVNIPGLTKVADQGAKLYRNENVRPRFEFTDRLYRYAADDMILEDMKKPGFDFGGAATTQEITLAPGKEALKSAVAVDYYSPNLIKLNVETNKEAVLVIKNAYYPQWKVKVDNKDERLYNVNYAFMGVKTAPGRHSVEIRYSKDGFYLALLLTLLGAIAYAAIFYYTARKREEK